jgi:hypothetical protein
VPRCVGTKITGEQCEVAHGQFGTDGKCFWHSDDPDVAGARSRARSQGGEATAAKPPRVPLEEIPTSPETLDDALRWLSWVAVESATRRLDPKSAQQISKAIEVWLKAQGYREQIQELRRMIADFKKQLEAFKKAKPGVR